MKATTLSNQSYWGKGVQEVRQGLQVAWGLDSILCFLMVCEKGRIRDRKQEDFLDRGIGNLAKNT
jgi:hypothetical protein